VVERETALAVFVPLPERDAETLTLVTWHGLSIADAGPPLSRFSIANRRGARAGGHSITLWWRFASCPVTRETDG
jgi:hypothetical protein